MAIKKTRLLVAELKVIAFTIPNKHIRNVLREAAERLEDTDKIAEFYRQRAETQGGEVNGSRNKLRRLSILHRRAQ